jgi:hypothetical protein
MILVEVKKENNFFADFAYLLEFNNNHKVSFGVKAGFTNLQTNFDGFVFESGNLGTDDAFQKIEMISCQM